MNMFEACRRVSGPKPCVHLPSISAYLKRTSCSGATSCTGQARTGGDEMDLTAFADFVLTWDYRSRPAAIKYFFPVLDLKNQAEGCCGVRQTFKEVHVMWVSMGEYADLTIYDVVDEILHMVKPKTATLITPEDRHERHLSASCTHQCTHPYKFLSQLQQLPAAGMLQQVLSRWQRSNVVTNHALTSSSH
ncbi:hypothetical protein V8C86DRAFT_1499193 [Haematococcus lacustris]